METKLQIPRILQQYCDGKLELRVDGETVGELLEEVKRQQPSLYGCICDETGKVRRHINLFLNHDLLVASAALDTPIESGDVVSVFQAVTADSVCTRSCDTAGGCIWAFRPVVTT